MGISRINGLVSCWPNGFFADQLELEIYFFLAAAQAYAIALLILYSGIVAFDHWCNRWRLPHAH
jgi:hypothetical protein